MFEFCDDVRLTCCCSVVFVFIATQRVFKHFPMPLTIPEGHEIVTGARLRPSVNSFVQLAGEVVQDNSPSHASSEHAHSLPHTGSSHKPPKSDRLDVAGLSDHLSFLITVAKNQLLQYRESWSTFPIYLRATGGTRALPPAARALLMDNIRILLSNSTFCPFYFQLDSARVLSGEEEAVFAWTAANYLHDRLLPDMTEVQASSASSLDGDMVTPKRSTYGTLDLGAASSQLAFFAPDQDISEGMFKLQLGLSEHWNLYAKSFLQFGYDAARQRHLQELAHQVGRGWVIVH